MEIDWAIMVVMPHDGNHFGFQRMDDKVKDGLVLKLPLAWLIQNGFTGEAKASDARKTGFSWLLVHFNLGLQNGFTL